MVEVLEATAILNELPVTLVICIQDAFALREAFHETLLLTVTREELDEESNVLPVVDTVNDAAGAAACAIILPMLAIAPVGLTVIMAVLEAPGLAPTVMMTAPFPLPLVLLTLAQAWSEETVHEVLLLMLIVRVPPANGTVVIC